MSVTNRTQQFMGAINSEGGFTCSFVDKQLTEFIQYKKRRSGTIPTKRAVSNIGLQPHENVWVLGPKAFIDGSSGLEVDSTECNSVWLGDLYKGSEIASTTSSLSISLPLNIDNMIPLVDAMRKILKHNFPPAIFAMGCTSMLLHYSTIIETNMCCAIPILFGPVGTGKSLSLRIALSIFGGQSSRFFTRGTKEKYMQYLSRSQIPIGIDDPQQQKTIGEMIVDLYNGALCTTIAHGDLKPLSAPIISSNFSMEDEVK